MFLDTGVGHVLLSPGVKGIPFPVEESIGESAPRRGIRNMVCEQRKKICGNLVPAVGKVRRPPKMTGEEVGAIEGGMQVLTCMSKITVGLWLGVSGACGSIGSHETGPLNSLLFIRRLRWTYGACHRGGHDLKGCL